MTKSISLAIVGDRNFTNYKWLCEVMDKVKSPIHQIVSGGARGADTLAEHWASDNNVDFLLFPADWDKFGKSAGYKRNIQIVDNADAVIAFLAPRSKGTVLTINLAKEKGIPVHIIHVS